MKTRERLELPEWQQQLAIGSKQVGLWSTLANQNPRLGQIQEVCFADLPAMRGGGADRILSYDLFNSIDISKLDEDHLRLLEAARVAGDIFARHFGEHLSFLSAVRGAPLLQTKTGPVLATVGKHGEESLRLLNALSQKGREKVELLEKWAARFGLGGLRGVWRGGDELTAAFVDPHSQTEIDSLMYAGNGSKHVVPVLVELAKAEPGDTLLLDEPETSLHPAGLLEIADVLVEAANRGVQIVLATQMPALVLAITRALRSRKRSDILRVVEVSRDAAGARATELAMSKNGYLTKWPYAEVEMELLKEVGDGPEKGSSDTASEPQRQGNPRRKRPLGHR